MSTPISDRDMEEALAMLRRKRLEDELRLALCDQATALSNGNQERLAQAIADVRAIRFVLEGIPRPRPAPTT